MDVSDLISGDFLKSEDMPDGGIELTILTIARNDRNPEKLEIGFKGSKKKLLANKTNMRRIAHMYGTDSDNWIGQRITIYNDPEVEFGDKPVGGIRVQVGSAAPPATAQHTSEQPGTHDDIPWD